MQVERSIVLPLPPEQAWQRALDPVVLADWLGQFEVEWAPGHHGRCTVDGVVHHVVVDVVHPPRLLALRWWAIDPVRGAGPATAVELRFAPVPAGTHVVVTEQPASRPVGFTARIHAS